jgi:hypothetical protein
MKLLGTALLSLVIAVVATPVAEKEERGLQKRGAVLSAQFATESEVGSSIHVCSDSILTFLID